MIKHPKKEINRFTFYNWSISTFKLSTAVHDHHHFICPIIQHMRICIDTVEKSRTARSDKNTNSCPRTLPKWIVMYRSKCYPLDCT